jgi:hypothetical protein
MTAREQILGAIGAVTLRAGRETFSPDEIVRELHRLGSPYSDSTIRTHITSRMCANAPGHHGVTYDDLERVGRGEYRLRQR